MIIQREFEEMGFSRWQLMRLEKMGVISKGEIVSHPDHRRGRVSVRPEEDLITCEGIAKLMKEGFSLRDAAYEHAKDKFIDIYQEFQKQVDLAEVELDKRLQPKEGEQFTLEGSMKKLIHYELRQLTEDKELQKKLIAEFERKKGLEHTLEIVLMGYNPVLLWSKEGVLEIVPDFLLGHHFASEFNKAGAYVLVPLLSHLSTIMRPFTGYDEFAYKPRTYASPKVLIREGRRLVEYEISLHGHFGFELVRKKGKDIGRIRK